jgi:membrane peptidoglycan carboxypeptidase
MSLTRKTKVWVLAIFLVPLFVTVSYVLFVVGSAAEKTVMALQSVTHYEHQGLKLESIPPEWLSHLLAVEDPNFFGHNGVDLSTPGAGLTTITQGLVKIHYFDEFKPGIAKLKQTILAMVLNSKITKKQQLMLFLNTARLGTVSAEPISGFSNAAVAYFGKGFSELTHREFISIVAMLVGPNRYNVAANPEENAKRVNRILAVLAGKCMPEGVRDVYYERCAA